MLSILAGPALLGSLALVISGLLITTRTRWPEQQDQVVTNINDLLPQTQCAQCGYPGCKPYAEAIAQGEAINKCPPGGEATIQALANLLGQDVIALDERCGIHQPPLVAVIREAECIGCTLCIQACPVDAIIGAAQMMHSVINEECTGCELCLPPCPVDCIDLVAAPISLTLATDLVNTNACIHCHLCEQVCPRDLAPQQLLLFKQSTTVANSLGLQDCIECTLCDRACPAEIPLTANFNNMKKLARSEQDTRQVANHARERYERRQQRLEVRLLKTKTRPSRADASKLLSALTIEKAPIDQVPSEQGPSEPQADQ